MILSWVYIYCIFEISLIKFFQKIWFFFIWTKNYLTYIFEIAEEKSWIIIIKIVKRYPWQNNILIKKNSKILNCGLTLLYGLPIPPLWFCLLVRINQEWPGFIIIEIKVNSCIKTKANKQEILPKERATNTMPSMHFKSYPLSNFTKIIFSRSSKARLLWLIITSWSNQPDLLQPTTSKYRYFYSNSLSISPFYS